jgi:hypothetical protein
MHIPEVLSMALPRPVVSPSRSSILAAIVGVGLLAASSPAGAANSLPAAPEARFVTSVPVRIDHEVVPAYAERCEPALRCRGEYVFAATRGLRQPGIDPVAAVVLTPATLVLDAVFFPFALVLDSF